MPDFDALTEWVTQNIPDPRRTQLLTWTGKLARFVDGLEEQLERMEEEVAQAKADAATAETLIDMLQDHRRGIRDLEEVFAVLDD